MYQLTNTLEIRNKEQITDNTLSSAFRFLIFIVIETYIIVYL